MYKIIKAAIKPLFGEDLETYKKVKAELKKALASYEITSSDPSRKAPKKWWDRMVKKTKKNYPDLSAERIDKIVGKIWSNLSDAKKSEIRHREGKRYGEPPKK